MTTDLIAPPQDAAPSEWAATPLQRAMLRRARSTPQDGVNVQQVIVTLREQVVPAYLREAWDVVAAQRDALRMQFGEDRVSFAGRVEVPWCQDDWSDLVPAELERLEEYLAEDRLRPFDFSQAPLMRVGLFQMGPSEWRMVWTFHHAILDGRSAAMVVREVFQAYRSILEGATPARSEAQSFASLLASREESAGAEAFWKKELAGISAGTRLDIPLPLSSPSSARSGRISKAATAALKRLAEANSCSVATIVNAAWALVLARHAASDDVMFGEVRSCRPESARDVAGMCVNTLPLRVHVAAAATVAEFLRSISETRRAIRDFENTDLADIQQWTGVDSLLHSVVMYDHANIDARVRGGADGWVGRRLEMRRDTGMPLTLVVFGGDEITFNLQAAPALPNAFLALAARRFAAALENLATVPAEALVADVSVADAKERGQIAEWTSGESVEVSHDTLDSLFSSQVDARGDALAVSWRNGALTYRQLHQRALFLAEKLPAGVLVAVVMEKCWEQVAAVLAIHYAGSAYVPVDASLPSIRRNAVLEKSGATVALVAGNSSLADWPKAVARIVVSGDEIDGPAPRKNQPTSLAYIIFTSGSTGEPKGVMIDHRGAVNTCLDVNRRHRMSSSDRVLGLSSLSFDLSVWDIWGTFAAGATLILPDAESAKEPGHWAEMVRAEQVTIWNSVPALLRLYVEYLEEHRELLWPKLRLALVSGDWVPLDLPWCFRTLLPDSQIVSMGGATEASIWSIDFPIQKVEPHWRSIPYGRAMANQSVAVLDSRMNPCECLVVGQIYIGGIGVALGYWSDHEKTAASFIIHPQTGERLYRTGDLGRWLPEGQIEFLGRQDFQVKVQGFRIELEEIESALLKHPEIREAVVVARGDRDGEKSLAAYVIPRGEHSPSGSELRTYLRERLPVYMVPTTFTRLESLPLSGNGKVDRKALPEPELIQESAAEEDPVFALVADVLRRDGLTENGSFLELGVSSLELIRLATAVEKQFGTRPRLAELYKEPTIAAIRAQVDLARMRARARIFELAKIIRALEPKERADALAAKFESADELHGEVGFLSSADRAFLRELCEDEVVEFTGDLPLTGSQRGVWILQQMVPEQTAYNIPMAWRLSGGLNVDALRSAVAVLVKRHPALRAHPALNESGEPVQRVVATSSLDLSKLLAEEDLTADASADFDALIAARFSEEQTTAFDFDQPPLMRIRLLKLPAGEHVLIWNVHHWITDAHSLSVLFAELNEIYAAGCRGEEALLPKAGDYAAAVSRKENGDLGWWRQYLSGAPATVPIAKDISCGPCSPFAGSTVSFELPADVVSSARSLAQQHRTTLNPVLFAAFASVLSRSSGSADLVIGTASSNREFEKSERVCGFFTHTLPTRIQTAGNPTFDSLVDTAHESISGVLAHEDVSLDTLIAELSPQMSGVQSPFFQHLFVYVTEGPVEGFALDSVVVEPLDFPGATSKFDLTLFVKVRRDGRVEGTLEYSAERFERVTAERLVQRFVTLLGDAVSMPSRSLADLRLMGDTEVASIATWSRAKEFRLLDEHGCDVPVGVIGRIHDKQGAHGLARWFADGGLEVIASVDAQSEAHAAAEGYVPSQNLLQTQVIEIWESVLEKRPIGIRDSFFKIGGRSLSAIRMLSVVAEKLGRKIPPGRFFEKPTVEAIASFLSSATVDGGEPWMRLNSEGTKPSFVYLHGDFCGGFYAHELARQLGPDQPVIAVHPHGTTGGTMPGTIREMAEDRLAALKKAGVKGPWILGGYCNGAFVALEMARQLELAGEKPPLVIMLMADGSNLRFRGANRAIRALSFASDEAAKEHRFLRMRNQLSFLSAAAKAFNALPMGEKVKRLSRKITGGTSQKTEPAEEPEKTTENAETPESCEQFGGLANIYIRAIQGYAPLSYGGKIVALWPQDEPEPWHAEDPARGWRDVAKEAEGFRVPGDHFSVISDSGNLKAVAAKIREVLGL